MSQHSPTGFTVLLTDIRFLTGLHPGEACNLDILCFYTCTHKPTYIVVTETHTGHSTTDELISIQGYQQLFRCDLNRYGEGVIVWAQDSSDILLEDEEPDDFELIGALYLPGSLPSSDASLIDYLDSHLPALQRKTWSRHTVLLSDFNVRYCNWIIFSSPNDTAGLRTRPIPDHRSANST